MIIARGTFLETPMWITHRIPRKVEIWCANTGLSVNPKNTVTIVFTRRYKESKAVVSPWMCWNRSSAVNANTLFFKISQRKKMPPTLVWIYKAISKSKLTYAALGWNDINENCRGGSEEDDEVMPSDGDLRTFLFDKKYKINLPSRTDCETNTAQWHGRHRVER